MDCQKKVTRITMLASREIQGYLVQLLGLLFKTALVVLFFIFFSNNFVPANNYRKHKLVSCSAGQL